MSSAPPFVESDRLATLDRYRARVLEHIARQAPLKESLTHLIGLLEAQYPDTAASIHFRSGDRLALAAAPNLPAALRKALASVVIDPETTPLGATVRRKEPVICDDVLLDTDWPGFSRHLGEFRSCVSLPIFSEIDDLYGVFTLYHERVAGITEDDLHLATEATRLASIAIGQRKLLAVAQYQSFTDPLTGLGNRHLMRDRLELALATHQDERAIVVLFLDIDDFKSINDSLGPSAGDAVLRLFGTRLKHTLRAGDTVARTGSDEFGVVLDVAEADDATAVTEKIVAALGPPFEVGDQLLPLDVSIGISLAPHDGRDAETLLRAADSALNAAKASVKRRYSFYQSSMTEGLKEQLALTRDLKVALQRDEFRLFYQPRLDPATRQTVSVEALIRWQHPSRGLLPPGLFLPTAERANLMPDIDRWVIRESSRQAQAFDRAGLALAVSCNLSAASFEDDSFSDDLLALIDLGDAPADRLEVEITESLVMQDVERAALHLGRLKAALPGIRVAIDDFGTGHSSLAYLRHLPVDTIKIDRLFIRDLDHADERTRHTAVAVIQTILTLAHNLRLTIVAEGVETLSQAEMLEGFGCNEVQGFVFSRPLPIEALLEHLAPKAKR